MPERKAAMRRSQHYPIPHHYPGTHEQPEEMVVQCACGEWEFSSIASAGGDCNTNWAPDFEAHEQDMAFD